MAQTNAKSYLFETMPIPKAVMELSIPRRPPSRALAPVSWAGWTPMPSARSAV